MSQQKIAGLKNANLMDSIQTEVAKEASPFLEFLILHSKKIIILTVLVLLIAVGFSAWRMHQENKLGDAREELGLIVARPDSGTKLEELKTFARRIDIAEVKSAALLALSSGAQEKGDYALAVQALEELTPLIPAGSPMYYTTQLGIASNLNKQDKAAEALNLVESLLRNAPPELTFPINITILDLTEKSGQWDRAIQACEAMLNNASETNDMTYLQQRIAGLQLKKESNK
jgi:predicted negative regulator of RcsB-dependent stress response